MAGLDGVGLEEGGYYCQVGLHAVEGGRGGLEFA